MSDKKKNDDNGVEHIIVEPLSQEIAEQKKQARLRAEELRKETGGLEQVIITENNVAKKVSDLNIEEQAVEIIRCASDPAYFIRTYFSIFDQTQGENGKIVPFDLFDFQEDLISDYQTHQLNIANKYRQAGISTCTSAYIAWYMAFNENRTVAIIADKLDTAKDEMMKDVVDFLNQCPEWLVPQPTVKDTQKHKIYSNDSEIKAFAASSLRGYTPTLLFWDETAWTENSEKFWTAARPAVLNTGGRCIFVSTPNGHDPIFFKTFDNARKKRNNFNAVELWWYNDPRYITNKHTGEIDLEWIKNKGREDEIRLTDDNWTKKKRIQMHNDGWEPTSSWFEFQLMEYAGKERQLKQEILCSFLGSGNNFIAELNMKYIKDNQLTTPIRQEYTDNEMYIFEDPLPDTQYLQSIDVSSGHGDDYSTINIFRIEETVELKSITKNGKTKEVKVRKHKAIQVAEYYNRVLPQELGNIAYEYGIRYNNAYTIIDIGGGYGAQTLEKLFDLGYEHIHYSEITHKATRDRLNGYIKVSEKTLPDGKVTKVDLVPGFLIGSNRGSVLIELQRSINMEDLVIRSARLYGELETFVTVPGTRVADHKRSYHDDSIMSTSMAVYCLFHSLFKLKDSVEKTKKILDAMAAINDNVGNEKIRQQKEQQKQRNAVGQRADGLNQYRNHSWLFSGLNKR